VNADDDLTTITYDGRRTRLESPIPPAGAITQTMLLDAPSLPGRYWLHLSLVQEARFWFDGLPGNFPRRITLMVSARRRGLAPVHYRQLCLLVQTHASANRCS
jgi:hypothetical protein